METQFKIVIGVALLLFLLILMVMISYTSWTIYQSATRLLAATADLPAADAIPLYIDLYSGIVKDGLAPLLNTLLIAFVAFVTGRTVSVVSYNATQARNPNSKPRLL